MSKSKLWQVDAGGLLPLIESFTVGEDYLLDQQLLPYDLQASQAHAEMLAKLKILTKKELAQAKNGLREILQLWRVGKFQISRSQEDGHTAIEQYLTEKYGAIGKKIHTGRSRNDQSLVMLRLFMKSELKDIAQLLQKVSAAFTHQSRLSNKIPMPGYTHLQKAMPTTVGAWLDSFRVALSDLTPLLRAVSQLIDQNPLGSASGFGITNFPLDRQYTTRQLGFQKTQMNPLYCGLSRGYFENIVLQGLSPIMLIAARFASDMLLFTTQEFSFFTLPNNFTTGSSIMPQKRNYDLFEIMRGNVKVFQAYQNQIQGIVASLGSGYQRDLQLTKGPFLAGVRLCRVTLDVLLAAVPNLKINKAKLESAMTQDLFFNR